MHSMVHGLAEIAYSRPKSWVLEVLNWVAMPSSPRCLFRRQRLVTADNDSRNRHHHPSPTFSYHSRIMICSFNWADDDDTKVSFNTSAERRILCCHHRASTPSSSTHPHLRLPISPPLYHVGLATTMACTTIHLTKVAASPYYHHPLEMLTRHTMHWLYLGQACSSWAN